MTIFVLDASVTLALIFEDESSPYADAVADTLALSTPVAPIIWPLEIANSILTAVRRGRIPAADVPMLFETMTRLRVDIDHGVDVDQLARDSLTLGLAHRLSSYDASYLELAIRRGIPLATEDRRLHDDATAAGVQFFQP